MIYDYIIIGAGIAGLYTAYNLKKNFPDKTFLILEANKKKYIGGRIYQEKFSNHLITTGAGIGRKKKDKYLIKLLDELNIKYTEFETKINYTFDPIDIKKTLIELRKIYEDKKPRISFKDFGLQVLGTEKYKQFLITSGYTDFENEDVGEVLYFYGFEDNLCCWTGLSIPWNELIKKLVENVSIENIKTNSLVDKIESKNLITVFTKYIQYKCNKLIIATTINSIKKLLKNPIYSNIGGQPFIKIYTTVAKKYIEIIKELVKNTVIVNNELQKIIPINPDTGLYMIAYSDNKNALKLINNSIEKNNEALNLDTIYYDKEYISRLIEKALNIKKIKLNKVIGYYREIGTHYYKPLDKIYNNRIEFIKKAQNPSKNIFVVGEVVSENQGWSNSALITYNKIRKFL